MTLESITKPISKLVSGSSSSKKSSSKHFGPEDKQAHVPEKPLVLAPTKDASNTCSNSSATNKCMPPRTTSGSPTLDRKVLNAEKANVEHKSSPRSVKQIDSSMPMNPRNSIKEERHTVKEELSATPVKDNLRRSQATASTVSSSGSTEPKTTTRTAKSRPSLAGTIGSRASIVGDDNRTIGDSSMASKDPPGRVNVPTTITVSEHERKESEDDSKAEVTLSDENSSNNVDEKVPEFVLQEQYGLDANPNEEHRRPTLDVERRKAQALCFAIGAEGVYTKEQEEWLMGLLTTTGYDQSIVQAVPTMLKESAHLLELELAVEAKQLISKDLRDGSPVLVYDAYRCAAVADFPNEQMCAIAMIAEEIGVNKFGHLESIRKQVVAEEELKKERIKLLFPEGHQCLDEQYEDLVGDANAMEKSNRDLNDKSSRGVDP